jgi:hypothetical protein
MKKLLLLLFLLPVIGKAQTVDTTVTSNDLTFNLNFKIPQPRINPPSPPPLGTCPNLYSNKLEGCSNLLIIGDTTIITNKSRTVFIKTY